MSTIKLKIQEYALKNVFERLLLLILLAPIFYLGIYINYTLLGLELTAFMNFIYITIIIILVIGELFFAYNRSKIYKVYNNKIVIDNEEINYSDINSCKISKVHIDKYLGTGTVIIESDKAKIYIKNIKEYNNVYMIIQKHIKSKK